MGEANALSVEDCNTAVKTGWYSFAYNSINKPEHIDYGVIFPISRLESSNAKEIVQIAIGCGNGASVSSIKNRITATRSTEDGITWSEWEYFNPPMVLGVEYRTTERWLGKPVYTTLLNIGDLPNNSTKNFGLSGITSVIRYAGATSTGTNIPNTYGGEVTNVQISKQNISVETNYDASASTGYFTLWYTKD